MGRLRDGSRLRPFILTLSLHGGWADKVTFASITGTAVCDPSSLPGDEECVKFKADPALWALTETQVKISEVNVAELDAVLFAGGFAVMWDYPESEAASQRVIQEMYEAGEGGFNSLPLGPLSLPT